ncbi:hypothetical protein B296_00048967 [Ensete ventricosum]|uniref:Uncharacterized protein n=1 Tax=Ensete ventricosum TaxID=4639 RepID=A0A426WX96_ENSVE|nr:hypothetical protein B296_00048967 [Ensete ventricosum]
MTSEEAINAKFEAFESRMEEKMRSLFAEFSIGRPSTGDSRRSKGATTVHFYDGDFLRAYPRRTIEPRGMKDKSRSPASHDEAYSPLYYHTSPRTKEINKIRAL